jgi:hypothetical protein
MLRGHSSVQFLVRFGWLLTALCGILFSGSASSRTAPIETAAGSGFVETAQVDPDNRTLTLSGWVAPQATNVFVTNLSIHHGGEEIYRGRFERSERADVVRATGREDWLWSGFKIAVNVSSIRGNHQSPLRVFARLGSGEIFELSLPTPLGATALPPVQSPGLWSLAALSLAVVLPTLSCALSFLPIRTKRRWDLYFAASSCLAFLLLVAGGWTGSSLGLALKASPMVEYGLSNWKGQDRSVRSDEWQVLTPLAISQTTSTPPFQITNKLLGIDGQNMMVMGMTGVPVAHLSSIAKPATWGFFFLDLRSALSWYWWFAFFASFIALWLVLIQFMRLDWRIAAVLSLIAAGSPYSVAYSGWPAYTTFFPLVALLALRGLLTKTNETKKWWVLGFGALIGWSIAGFALVLYPSWQISLIYLFLPLTLAWLWQERNDLRVGRTQALALAVGMVVAVGLLASWWLDSQMAVASVRSTVYPGGRSVEAGGDIDPWFLIKGWLSPVTMYSSSELMVPSDAGSFIFVIWVAIPALIFRMFRTFSNRGVDWIGASLIATTAFILAFMFVGFDKRFAQITFLGMATSYRMDLVLGVTQTFILALLISPSPPDQTQLKISPKWVCAALALASMAWASWLAEKLPVAIFQTVPSGFLVLTYLSIGLTTYTLLNGHYLWALATLAIWTTSASIPFNPVGQATDRVTMTDAFAKSIAGIDPTDPVPAIAVIGERDWAMTLPAAGARVVNTVFYYPQKTLWKKLDANNQHAAIHNRYHRLLLYFKTLPKGTGHTLESPRLDEVRVFIDPEQFDFRKLGAKAIILTPTDGKKVRVNKGVALVEMTDQWEIFRVLP